MKPLSVTIEMHSKLLTIQLLTITFLWYCLFSCIVFLLTFESVDETLKYDHSNESYLAIILIIICLFYLIVWF